MADPAYRLSVVIATTVGWPRMRLSLDSVVHQLAAIRGQLIVADSSGQPVPEAVTKAVDTIWLERPGAGVFQLRREGYEQAAGEIIAATEDHCRPAGDWVERILAAHAARPDAAAIGGAVENGTPHHAIDWAIYFVTQLPWAPPLPEVAERIVGHTNISYKRSALADMPHKGRLTIEILYNRLLREQGQTVIADDSIRVRHFQSMGIRRTTELEFHNGRSIGGLRRERMRPRDWLRAAAPPVLAAYRLARTARQGVAKPFPRATLVAALPFICWLHIVHAMGESAGYLWGPGDSPARLH